MPLITIIHLGFPNTGTTILQNHLFSQHSQIRYLGKPYKDDTFKTHIHLLAMQESLVYDPSSLKELLKQKISE